MLQLSTDQLLECLGIPVINDQIIDLNIHRLENLDYRQAVEDLVCAAIEEGTIECPAEKEIEF